MSIKEKINERKYEREKSKNLKKFLECLTDESKDFFEYNYGTQHGIYNDILKKGWHVGDDYNLYHNNSNAYLLMTDNGYVIPEDLDESDLAIAQKFYNDNKGIIYLYNTSTCNIIAFNNGQWETREGYDVIAEYYGDKVGIRKKVNYTLKCFTDIAFVDDKEYDENDSLFVQDLLDYYDENREYVDLNGNYTEDYEKLYNTIFEDDIEDEQDWKKWNAEMYRIIFEEDTDEIVEEKVNKIGTM